MVDHTSASSHPEDHPDWEAIARFLAGESPEPERTRVQQWLAGAPADAAFLSALARMRLPQPEIDVDQALQRVHSRLDAAPVVSLGARRRRILLAAAAVLLVAGGLTWTRWPAAVPARTGGQLVTLHTTVAGERRSVRLPDGSEVVLGSLSRMQIAPEYGRGDRVVHLTGEAFFRVRHADRPFVVRVGHAIVRDIGTAFVVRQLADGELRVAVTEGLVAVRATGDAPEVQVSAGSGVRVTESTVVREPGRLTRSDTAWKHGELVFEGTPVEDVAAAVTRRHGVPLVFDPHFAGRRITAAFRDEGVDRVAEVLALTLGARVEEVRDTVRIRPR